MDKKAIYDKYFTRVYYFAYHYFKDDDRASDMAIAVFLALFSGNLVDEDAIKEFLYRHIARSCANYYTNILGLPAPDAMDFLNTILDAEFLYLKYQESA